MANKRYDQFAAGSYDPTRILLTADPATGELKKVALSTLIGYKQFAFIFNQSGTSAPTFTAIINTLGGTVAPARTAVGKYTGTLAGAFVDDKTIVAPFGNFGGSASPMIPLTDTSGIVGYLLLFLNPDDSFEIWILDPAFALAEYSTIMGSTDTFFNIIVGL